MKKLTYFLLLSLSTLFACSEKEYELNTTDTEETNKYAHLGINPSNQDRIASIYSNYIDTLNTRFVIGRFHNDDGWIGKYRLSDGYEIFQTELKDSVPYVPVKIINNNIVIMYSTPSLKEIGKPYYPMYLVNQETGNVLRKITTKTRDYWEITGSVYGLKNKAGNAIFKLNYADNSDMCGLLYLSSDGSKSHMIDSISYFHIQQIVANWSFETDTTFFLQNKSIVAFDEINLCEIWNLRFADFPIIRDYDDDYLIIETVTQTEGYGASACRYIFCINSLTGEPIWQRSNQGVGFPTGDIYDYEKFCEWYYDNYTNHPYICYRLLNLREGTTFKEFTTLTLQGEEFGQSGVREKITSATFDKENKVITVCFDEIKTTIIPSPNPGFEPDKTIEEIIGKYITTIEVETDIVKTEKVS